ncbi:MAG: hypothetical protein II005_02350 [Turicibacter sp.]|nr:hypothetical protein [Turicibacter sp.]
MKRIPTEQWALIIVAGLYLLETILIGGLFTNLLLFGMTIIIGIVATVIAISKQRYQWALIDVFTCLVCSGIVYYLYVVLAN